MPTGDRDLLSAWSRDWERLRMQKHRVRGGVEASMLLDYLLYQGEHQSTQVQNAILTRAFKHTRDKNKLRLVVNLARRAVDRKIGRHWSINHKFKATPNITDPIAYDYADVIGDQLLPAIDYKLQAGTLRWMKYLWLVVTGVVFTHNPWVDGMSQDVLPKYADGGDGGEEGSDELLWLDSLTGAEIPESQVEMILAQNPVASERFRPATEVRKTGDLDCEVYDPFRVFVDASVPLVKRLGPDQAIYLADLRTRGWIKETFGSKAAKGLEVGKDLSIIKTQMLDRGMPVSGMNLKDLLPLVHGSQGKDDPDTFIVLTRYQPASDENPEGKRGYLVPNGKILDDSDNPYPQGEIPIVDTHWSAPGASMWTPGFVRDLQAVSRFINKRFSQLGEAANSQLYEMMLLGGDLKSKDIPADFPGVVEGGINEETGAPNVQIVPRGSLPSFFPDSIKLSMETMDMLSSSDLLSQRKFPGQIRGSLAMPILQELMDSEDGPRFTHTAEQASLEKMQQLNRVKQFYPPIRTMNYAGQSNRMEVLEFHTDELLRAGIDFTVTVDPGSIFPEISAMREARIRERLEWAPGLYTNADTGTIDWSAVATDLKYNDSQREGVATRGRKLARQLIQWARQGKLTVSEDGPPDPKTGKPVPALVRDNGQTLVVAPFWPHHEMLDQYKTEMISGEFLEASPAYQRVMYVLYDLHRTIIAGIDQSRQASVDNKMMQGAVAQATQQAAAKAASTATDIALEQVMAQKDTLDQSGRFGGLSSQIQALLGAAQAQSPQQQPDAQGGGRPINLGPRRLNQ